MREADTLLVAGLVLFVAGATLILVALNGGPAALLGIGLAGLVGAVACLALGTLRRARRVDWDRVATEQRLWESGPLGRTWLRIRQILLGG